MAETSLASQAAGAGTYALRQRRFGWAVLAPALAVLAAVLAYPIGASIWLSFHRVQLAAGGLTTSFTGLDNFVSVLANPTVRSAAANSVYFVALEVVLVLGLSTAFAMLLNGGGRVLGLARIVLLIPWAIAPVANAVLWKWILNGNYGVLGAITVWLGLTERYPIWLGTPSSALHTMLVVDVWKSVPFVTLLLLAGLQKIPPTLYRAARIDGASGPRLFWHITLPSLRTTLATALVLQTVWSLRLFDLIYVLTRGGPADGTVMLNFLAYRETFNHLRIGYGAAVADLLFAFTFVLAILYIRLFRSRAAAAGARP